MNILAKHLLAATFFITMPVYAIAAQYIDLTHDYSSQTLHWPGSPAFTITHTTELTKPVYVTLRDYASNEHTGTHIDAPIHFAKGHPTVDKIPLTDLIGPAIKIDIRNDAKNNPDYQISIKDFMAWEKTHGEIPAHTIILLSTGYGKYWPNMEKYSGTKNPDGNNLHFPGLAPETAIWLIKERKIKAIGIDTFSIDYGQSKSFGAHQTLTKHNIPIFENVASMDALPESHFQIYALPMKIKNGTGAPLRIIAEI